MPLVRIPDPFDDPEWLWELKWDGFRALAFIEGHECRLVSRTGHVFKSWPQLAEELAHAVRAHYAILDGEITCLDDDGRSNFRKLLFRREWPYFFAFDVLALDGNDLRGLPLMERKRRLARIMPRVESRVRFVVSRPSRGGRWASFGWPASAPRAWAGAAPRPRRPLDSGQKLRRLEQERVTGA